MCGIAVAARDHGNHRFFGKVEGFAHPAPKAQLAEFAMESLDSVLDDATKQNMCTKWNCTTCGTVLFRGAVARHLGTDEPLSTESLRQLGKELSELKTIRNVDAVEFLVLWVANSLGRDELTSALGNCPTGLLYRRMLTAKSSRDEARRDHEKRNNPEFVEADRAVRKEAKAAAHAERRLRQKAIRDAKWRQKSRER